MMHHALFIDYFIFALWVVQCRPNTISIGDESVFSLRVKYFIGLRRPYNVRYLA